MDCNCFRPVQGVKESAIQEVLQSHMRRSDKEQIQIILEKNRGRKIDKTVVVQTKHSFQDSSKITQRFTAEQHPSEVNHDHGIQMAHKARKVGKLFQKKGVLHVDEQEEIQSPENKVPAGSVPESGKSPDN